MTKPKPISEVTVTTTHTLKPGKGRVVIDSSKTPPEVLKIDHGLCIPSCEFCGGLGLLRYDVPVGHPNFGQLHDCPNLPPSPINYSLFGLTEQFTHMGWGDILPINDGHQTRDILKDLLSTGYGWLYLHGANGLGKTFSASIAVAEALRQGMSAEIMVVADLLDYLRDAYSAESPIADRVNKIIDLDLLVLDEFGAQYSTPWAEEKIQTILQKRYRNASEEGRGITIFTSEFAPEDSLAPYIQDRLRDSRFGKNTIIKLTGKSVRPVAGQTK